MALTLDRGCSFEADSAKKMYDVTFGTPPKKKEEAMCAL
jgi:hypothetical protein